MGVLRLKLQTVANSMDFEQDFLGDERMLSALSELGIDQEKSLSKINNRDNRDQGYRSDGNKQLFGLDFLKQEASRITIHEDSLDQMELKAFILLEQRKVQKGLDIIERLIMSKADVLNENDAFKLEVERIIQQLNEVAMKAVKVKKDTGEFSLYVLKFCEETTNPGKFRVLLHKARNLTLNNIACIHRRNGQMSRANKYLERAPVSYTHLTLPTIYSV
eukprot:TRINITY_DN23309_c0_g1_i1.p1 TRINITY_DN23309_c0_g1~~TRINITY_DN23309_c0_g1_i1.p1  ORF type:complete len:219 (-),score=37.81 TRINITY_DN23309_c0_g1_i1:31-687(-)